MPLPLETAWWASVFTIPFYFLIYMYLDAIIPNTYGVAQPWCFCCKVKSKRSLLLRIFCCKKEKDEVIPGEESPIKQAGDPLIVMLNTSKQFETFKAVDNLSLKVHQNEILALLGHNGAGKTTAIGMLTGMLQPTEGEVFINGYSMKTDINQARL
jgi:ABC-type bacteriocin/lantibiotic exporter with double-glycine peptidase domain